MKDDLIEFDLPIHPVSPINYEEYLRKAGCDKHVVCNCGCHKGGFVHCFPCCTSCSVCGMRRIVR